MDDCLTQGGREREISFCYSDSADYLQPAIGSGRQASEQEDYFYQNETSNCSIHPSRCMCRSSFVHLLLFTSENIRHRLFFYKHIHIRVGNGYLALFLVLFSSHSSARCHGSRRITRFGIDEWIDISNIFEKREGKAGREKKTILVHLFYIERKW